MANVTDSSDDVKERIPSNQQKNVYQGIWSNQRLITSGQIHTSYVPNHVI